jgi:hypothetical protein
MMSFESAGYRHSMLVSRLKWGDRRYGRRQRYVPSAVVVEEKIVLKWRQDMSLANQKPSLVNSGMKDEIGIVVRREVR